MTLNVLLLAPLIAVLGCSQTTQTTHDTAHSTDSATLSTTGTTSTTSTGTAKETGQKDAGNVTSFTSYEGDIVTEQVLNIEVDEEISLTVVCSADIAISGFSETHTVDTPTPALSHSVRISGLLSDTTYNCTTTNARTNLSTTFTTGVLPASLMNRFETPTGVAPSGYMLFNTFGGPGGATHWLVIQDYAGNIRWYADGSIYSMGIIALEYEPDLGEMIAGGGLNGGYYPPSFYSTSGVLTGQIKTMYADHDIDYYDGSLYTPVLAGDYSCIQRWSLETLQETWEWCPSEKLGYNINSIGLTKDGSDILVTTYQPSGGIIKVSVESKSIVWTLSPDGSGDFSVDSPVYGLALQHDIAAIDCDSAEHDLCFIVYDNGSDARGYSQILSYGVNETKMTATLLRSFTRDNWFEGHSGGVHQMPNGEWLVSIASLSQQTKTIYVIVSSDGEEVWEMTSARTDIGGYRARYLDPCEIFNHTGMCTQ